MQFDKNSFNNSFIENSIFNNGLNGGLKVGIAVFGKNNEFLKNHVYDDRNGVFKTQIFGFTFYPNGTGNLLVENTILNNKGVSNLNQGNTAIYDQNLQGNAYLNNIGYNPIGSIVNPILGNYIVDLPGNNSTFVSERVYTNVGSPKELGITARNN